MAQPCTLSISWQRQHYSAVDPACLHVGKDAIYIGELGFVYVRPHLAFGSKLDCFGKVIAVSNDRPTQRDALQDHVENRNGKRPRWQTDEADCSTAPDDAERL
jgi:hypothetical protein